MVPNETLLREDRGARDRVVVGIFPGFRCIFCIDSIGSADDRQLTHKQTHTRPMCLYVLTRTGEGGHTREYCSTVLKRVS